MISFIIPAHNEEPLLPRSLSALDGAARSLALPFEVVVVDDSSTDRTGAIARAHGARVVQVRHRQIAATRNAGAREARGEMLVFVDADTTVSEGAVGAAVRAMRSGAAGGGCAFRFGGRLPLYGRVLQAVAVPLYRAAGLASGCFLFCTREAFRATGGFDEGMFGAEEAAMSRALRRQGRFVVLRESVTTSGRKLRAYSGREVLGTMARLAFTGRRSIRQREGLDVWYGERRPDPEQETEPSAWSVPGGASSVGSTFYVAAAVAIGACLSLQPPINAVMARNLGSPLLAASISIAISLVVVLPLWLAWSRADGDLAQVAALPWWVILGGVIGVVFVAGSILVAPPMGLALFFVCVVAGQLLGSILADQLGAFGMPVKPITMVKLVGLGLVVAGAALVQHGNA